VLILSKLELPMHILASVYGILDTDIAKSNVTKSFLFENLPISIRKLEKHIIKFTVRKITISIQETLIEIKSVRFWHALIITTSHMV
jgi:hypothetical protein